MALRRKRNQNQQQVRQLSDPTHERRRVLGLRPSSLDRKQTQKPVHHLDSNRILEGLSLEGSLRKQKKIEQEEDVKIVQVSRRIVQQNGHQLPNGVYVH